MERTPVQSSNLVSIGYDADLGVLEVEFKCSEKGDKARNSNPVYQYSGVPDFIAEELMRSETKGSYLHREIKPHYACKKVEFKCSEKGDDEEDGPEDGVLSTTS